MRSFRKVLLFFAVVILYEGIFSFLLEPVTYGHFLDIELEKDRENGKIPDMAVIGDSCTEMDFVPSVLERELEGEGVSCVLNAGTGSQMIWGTYYYLKDLFRQYDLKYVVVGIDYGIFAAEEDYVPKRELVVLDRIKSMDIKAEYIGNCLEWQDWLQLLTSYRYRENMESMAENLKAKLEAAYREGVDTREGTHYQERGYVYTEERGELRTRIHPAGDWRVERISDRAMEYLDCIVDLCREEDAELFLVAMPYSFSGIYQSETHQPIYAFFSAYAAEKGVPFWDFNLLRDRMRLLPDSMFSDEGHLGGNGALVCSSQLGKIMRDRLAGKDVSGYFYGSVEEMKADTEGIVACDFGTRSCGENGGRLIEAESIHAPDVVPEYEYWVREEGGEWVKLQEYGESTQCRIPAAYLDGKITIQVRCRRQGDTVEWERRTEKVREPGME